MSELWLSPAEVKELTGGRVRFKAQCRALVRLGLPFTVNDVGRPLVECARVVSSPAPAAPRRKAERGPNWEALDGTNA